MNNNQNLLKEKIAKVLTEVLSRNVQPNELTNEVDLINEIGLNSLQFLEFILEVENEFDIEIDVGNLDLRYFKKYMYLEKFISECIAEK
ncbi:Acyl carrier protein [Kordia antarctica]|uniref:Acyl carrier protein n=1 Tax=Kordia antarctica TaxID=1218801 RepID=A0A7L4ZG97_9FLAO|nr:acyl carrier protein [Kordia antarctica]QHI35467.1 Acyl carrier protein [Kordia antarctica]